MVLTRRRAHAQALQQRKHFLNLPPELHREIFEYVTEFSTWRERTWFNSLVTLCKALQYDIEVLLYREVIITRCRSVVTFCRAVAKRNHRATAVERLLIYVAGGISIKDHISRAFPVLTRLTYLQLHATEARVFEALLDAPFRLTRLHAGGDCYPACFDEILKNQPGLTSLAVEFIGEKKVPEMRRDISQLENLPRLRSLSVRTDDFPLTCIKSGCNITNLTLLPASHEDIKQAFALFGSTLESFTVTRGFWAGCTTACFWPTSIFRDVRLPNLRYIKINDCYFLGSQHLPANMDYMVISSLHEACPALRAFVWIFDYVVWDQLHTHIQADNPHSQLKCVEYAQWMFDCLSKLEDLVAWAVSDTLKDESGGVIQHYGRSCDGYSMCALPIGESDVDLRQIRSLALSPHTEFSV
ncbi:hypothetical protein ONZ51_g11489 [Trametes cubensis]|uniref:Uncharacterized protein n=1 Tax=Trametes cubensis TaxID=1111947 RepID=A0AAD7X423_9APHY|nr:hypothetical protein ONZ51_g11489 [Trametes cubensis]